MLTYTKSTLLFFNCTSNLTQVRKNVYWNPSNLGYKVGFTRAKLPVDLSEGVLGALEQQALGQVCFVPFSPSFSFMILCYILGSQHAC
jgi:hypothetical protein